MSDFSSLIRRARLASVLALAVSVSGCATTPAPAPPDDGLSELAYQNAFMFCDTSMQHPAGGPRAFRQTQSLYEKLLADARQEAPALEHSTSVRYAADGAGPGRTFQEWSETCGAFFAEQAEKFAGQPDEEEAVVAEAEEGTRSEDPRGEERPAKGGFNAGQCTFNGKKLYGRVKVVSFNADLKVKVVRAGFLSNLRVQKVKFGASKCGQWELVTSGPADLTVQEVSALADLEVEYVKDFPGAR